MRSLCVLGAVLLLVGSAAALEGKLPPASAAKIEGTNWSMSYVNAKGDVLIKWINSLDLLKVTADAELNNVLVAKIKFEGVGFVFACDEIAKALGAKAVVNGDGIFITRGGAPGPAAGNNNGGGNAGGNAGGNGAGMGGGAASNSISWTQLNAFGCKAARKPVALFVYDKMAKGDDRVLNFFNNSLFMDPNVEKTLVGFSCIKLDSTSTMWPTDMMQRAKTSGAVFVLTCDGAPLAAYDRNTGIPTVKNFLDACQRAYDANAKIVEKYVKEDEAKRAQEDKTKKETTVGGIPGLGGKSGEKSPDPSKSNAGKVDEEGK